MCFLGLREGIGWHRGDRSLGYGFVKVNRACFDFLLSVCMYVCIRSFGRGGVGGEKGGGLGGYTHVYYVHTRMTTTIHPPTTVLPARGGRGGGADAERAPALWEEDQGLSRVPWTVCTFWLVVYMGRGDRRNGHQVFGKRIKVCLFCLVGC